MERFVKYPSGLDLQSIDATDSDPKTRVDPVRIADRVSARPTNPIDRTIELLLSRKQSILDLLVQVLLDPILQLLMRLTRAADVLGPGHKGSENRRQTPRHRHQFPRIFWRKMKKTMTLCSGLKAPT
jgi:hypothetical protein